MSEIIPLAKKNVPKVLNDYRPVALTAIPMKCLEKIIKSKLLSQVRDYQDPFQFAYTCNRGVEDPTACVINDILEFLDKPSTKSDSRFVKILFIDISSAFNSIQPYRLLEKLVKMKVHHSLIRWLHCFLTGRSQYVKLRNTNSDIMWTNTGALQGCVLAQQGCVLSPVLFPIYTSDCRTNKYK